MMPNGLLKDAIYLEAVNRSQNTYTGNGSQK